MGFYIGWGFAVVNVCVVGCGHWGKNHVRNFAQLENLYAVCDANPEASARLGAQFNVRKIHATFDAVLADPQVQAIVLATPAEQHFAMGMAALRAGKDLLVEKPLALEAEQGEQMVRAGSDAGRILMVGISFITIPR